MRIKQQNHVKASQQLPPLRKAKDEQEVELRNLIKKNLLYDKTNKGQAAEQLMLRDVP